MREVTVILLLLVLAKIIFQQPKKPKLILTATINNVKIKILAMTLQTKQFVTAALGLVDHDTQNPIEATFENVALTSSDPSIFTVDTDVNGDGNVDVVGVAPGTATLNVKADVTYEDANTGLSVTASKEANIEVTVTLPPETTDLVVTFSDPQPVPDQGSI